MTTQTQKRQIPKWAIIAVCVLSGLLVSLLLATAVKFFAGPQTASTGADVVSVESEEHAAEVPEGDAATVTETPSATEEDSSPLDPEDPDVKWSHLPPDRRPRPGVGMMKPIDPNEPTYDLNKDLPPGATRW